MAIAVWMRLLTASDMRAASPMRVLKQALPNAYDDIAVIAAAAGGFAAAFVLTRRWRLLGAMLAALHLVYAVVMAIMLCVNTRALAMLGGALTYQWIYYADLLRSFTARSSVDLVITLPFLALLIASVVAVLFGPRLLEAIGQRLHHPRAMPIAAIAACVLVAGYLIALHGRPEPLEPGRTVNPLRELVSTTLAAHATMLSTIATPYGDDDFRVVTAPPAAAPLPAAGAVRNVLLVVLESVGAANIYDATAIDRTGRRVAVTPNIDALRAGGLSFTRIYAHGPASTKSMFSLLTSRYPTFTIERETQTLRDLPFAMFNRHLQEAGRRTGLFMSGDLAYQNVDLFLKTQGGFDVMQDMTTIPCNQDRHIVEAKRSNLDSLDDRCMAAAVNRWIGDGAGKPFFAMLWTGNTHWPYYPLDDDLEVPADTPFHSRYVNALHASDAALGSVIDHLRANGLIETTLIVVVGDHGEAFGQHGYIAHANSLFDEEVRVPLILSNPAMFHHQVRDTAGGLVDIAPTILDAIGIRRPPGWQGRGLFEANRSPRAYFFATNRRMLAGYYENGRKYALDTSRDRLTAYDVRADPLERRNLDKEAARMRPEVVGRLAAWVRYHEKLYARPD